MALDVFCPVISTSPSNSPVHVAIGVFSRPRIISVTVQVMLILSPAIPVPIAIVLRFSVLLAVGTGINGKSATH